MFSKPEKIERLKVLAFKNPDQKGSAEEFSFMINPDTIASRHENQFGRLRGINTSGRTAPYSFSSSDQLSMQLTLDNTLLHEHLPNALPSAGVPVKKQVDNFLKSCFYMDGDLHEPRFLLVEWGSFAFECRLKSVSVTYSHFNDNGEALRAKLDTVFVADMPDQKRLRLENKKSPDITHSRIVLEGHTLTGLTKEVYGDANHYLMVAAFNQLDHFRRLTPGERLFFPPLEK